MCGVCKGKNETCESHYGNKTHADFRKHVNYNSGYFYYSVVTIPKGATNIEITQPGYENDLNYIGKWIVSCLKLINQQPIYSSEERPRRIHSERRKKYWVQPQIHLLWRSCNRIQWCPEKDWKSEHVILGEIETRTESGNSIDKHHGTTGRKHYQIFLCQVKPRSTLDYEPRE